MDQGFSPAYGARFLKRTIDEKVKLPVTTLWKTADTFQVYVEDGEIRVVGEDSAAPARAYEPIC